MYIIKIGCVWCGPTGWIMEDHRCGKCGRTDNYGYELNIQKLQRLPHRNPHTNESDVQKGSKSKKGNPNGYGKRREG